MLTEDQKAKAIKSENPIPLLNKGSYEIAENEHRIYFIKFDNEGNGILRYTEYDDEETKMRIIWTLRRQNHSLGN